MTPATASGQITFAKKTTKRPTTTAAAISKVSDPSKAPKVALAPSTRRWLALNRGEVESVGTGGDDNRQRGEARRLCKDGEVLAPS